MTAYDDTVRGPVPTPQDYWKRLATTPRQELKVKRLHPDAVIPQYATDGSGCFDLHAVHVGGLTNAEWDVFEKNSDLMRPGVHRHTELRNGEPQTFRTGLAFEVPAGHVMLIFSRSGHGFKYDTRLANCVGVIDSDYRGEVMVRLTRDTERTFFPLDIKSGDRIAQAMLVPIPRVQLVEVDELSDTERGAGGFGSTGA